MASIGSLDDTVLAELVSDAAAAPCVHDAQPWRFRYHRSDALLELRAAPDRGLAPSDPRTRSLHVGCGAALFNLRVAAWHAGLAPRVEPLPDDGDPRELAAVRLEPAPPDGVDGDLAALHEAIEQRHTSRYPFADRPIPEELRDGLVAEARLEGARLSFPTNWHLDLVLELIEEAELAARHRGDPAEERWRPRGTALADTAMDGIDTELEGLPYRSEGRRGHEARAPVRALSRDPGVLHHPPGGGGVPQLGLISTEGDGPRDWLTAGQAMERVLLQATREGLASSFATQALERPDLRWLLRDPVWGTGPVHMVLRLGYGPMGPRAPRPPVGDVLEVV